VKIEIGDLILFKEIDLVDREDPFVIIPSFETFRSIIGLVVACEGKIFKDENDYFKIQFIKKDGILFETLNERFILDFDNKIYK
jgi:hypothetical protein